MYTREELEAEGLTDFRVLLCHVWEYLRLPEPTPVQLDIASRLQDGPRRDIICAFRGVGKSWITVAFVLWVLLLDPDKKIIVVSANQKLSDDFSKFCKQLIEGMPLFQHLAPREGQRDSSISFDVGPAHKSKDPSVKSAGITGQITGSRADLIVADDIEVPKNSYTHLLRERLAELIKEFDSVLKPEGEIKYLGTPQIESSVYNRLLDRGYSMCIWPAEIPASVETYKGRLAPYIVRLIEKGAKVGTPVDPRRFGREDLDERKASQGRSGYALQFMLDTNPSDRERYPLKLKDLIITDCDDDLAPSKLVWAQDRDLIIQDLASGGLDGDHYYSPMTKQMPMVPYGRTVMAIDPSGKGTDETAYAIGRLVYSTLYVVDVGGFRDGFSEDTLKLLAGKAFRWKAHDIIIEENYGGGMFTSLLKPHIYKLYGPTVNPEDWDGWSRGQKEHRILDILEPVVQNHRLVVDRRVIEADLKQQHDNAQYSFVQQFTRMTRDRNALPHEDRLEAVSMMVGYFTEKLGRDQDRAVEAHNEGLMEEEIQRFLENAVTPGLLGDSQDANWRDDMNY